MDNPKLVGSDAYGIGREWKLTAADLRTLGGSGGNIILGDLPGGSLVQETRVKHTQQVVGGGTCTVQLISVDMTASPPTQIDAYGAALTASGAVDNTAAGMNTGQMTSGNVVAFDKPVGLAAKVTGTNLQNVTAGSISMFCRYKVIAPAPPLRFDTTAVTPRAMPAY